MKGKKYMKRILFIKNIPSPYRLDFFQELGKETDLTVWFEDEKVDSRQWKSNMSNRTFKYKFFDFKSNLFIVNTIKVLKEFKKERYDVYIVGGYSTPIGLISIIYLKLTGKKFILNGDGGFIKKEKKINYFFKKLFISSADYWLSSGKNCTRYFIYYGAKQEKIFEYPFSSVGYNDKDLAKLSNDKLIDMKKTENLNDIVLISVGSFIERKGIDILIKGFEKIKTKYSNLSISLLLIGGGELKAKYISYIKKNNIKDIVIIDFLDKNELINYYKMSDIFILPTREDIWGLVINEAMEFGLPIISSNMAGAAHDLMVDGKNGYVFKSEDVDELCKKLEKIILDKNIREKFGSESKKIIRNYSIRSMTDRHLEIFNSIVS